MRVILISSLLAASSAWARPADPGPLGIVNGDEEKGYPSAVSLGLQFGSQRQSTCTGSLIAPQIVLTAAHCTQEYVKAGVPPEAIVEVGRVFTAPDVNKGPAVELSDFTNHPKYDGIDTGLDLPAFDFGVVFLAEPVLGVEPVWFNTEALGEDVVGERLVSVGYGITSAMTQAGAGIRRSAPIRISGVDGQFLLSDTSDNPDKGNICSGDSGGPQYHQDEDGRLIQWSIHSWADQNCQQLSGSSRTDKGAEWILSQVESFYGTTDFCAISGLYADAKCDAYCDAPDPACGPAGAAAWLGLDGETPG
ncbi:MAG TPA: trypsin-like serine protease, partial [Myxococcota bacterium]|nr:trypsin-like serine protease [Myxococcota bacterium]